MEDEVCRYQKYGFCKFKEKGRKRHLKEECKDLSDCKSQKVCNKRHPKICRRYVNERSCSFGQSCEYFYEEKDISEEENTLQEKIVELEKVVKKSLAESKMENTVKELEKVVKAMTRKVLYLEEEVKNISENGKKN